MSALKKSLAQALRQWSKVDKSTIRFTAPYKEAHKDVQKVSVANIATNLGPRLDDVLVRGSRLCVIGYDGASLTKKGYPWRRKISKWLKWGCSVDYFLHSPAHGVVASLSDIARRAPKSAGKIRVFQPKKRLSTEQESEIQYLKTFHFAVSENPMTLWLEGNHLTSEPRAFDCYFFPNKAATETGLGETYLKKFNRIISQACSKVPLVPANSVQKRTPATVRGRR